MAVVGHGDARDPRMWSGTSARVVHQLEALGVDVAAVDAWGGPPGARERLGRVPYVVPALRHRGPPGWRETSSRLAELSPRAWAARNRRVRRADATRRPSIALRAWFVPAPGTRYVVLDDQTIAQGIAVDHAGMAAAPRSLTRTALRHQREAYRSALACCAGSRWAAASMLDDYGIPNDRVHVVGIPCERVPDEPLWERCSPRFLFIGLDWERKNGPLVVETFRRLHADTPHARLDVVGLHPPIDAPGVVTHGPLPRHEPQAQARKRDLLRRATCLVMPSLSEGFGVVHVEAANYGVPSIGTTIGGSADAIGPGGVLVSPDEPAQLLDAMRRMGSADESIRLGRAARRYSALLTPQMVTARLLNHLLPGAMEAVPDLTAC